MQKIKLFLFLIPCTLIISAITSCTPVKYYNFDAMNTWKSNRVRINMSKEQIIDYYENEYENIDSIEGIWLYSFSYEFLNNSGDNLGGDTDKNVWKVAIIKDLSKPYSEEYFEVLFEPLGDNSGYSDKDIGIIKGYFKADLFPNNYILKTPMGPIEAFPNINQTKGVTLKDNIVYSVRKFKLENKMLYSKEVAIGLTTEYLYTKEPFLFEQLPKPNDAISNSLQSGSGAIISESGLVVTNYHVIEEKTEISVLIPQQKKEYNAELILKDKNNDLAILRLLDFDYSVIFLNTIPFTITSSSNSKLGEDVFTLGFPLGDILGKTVKFSSGKINSLFGIQDDPRVFQISNPIQPGNSGGPLFNSNGEYIGVVFSSLNAKFFYENTDIIPQNVNFAVKSNYLLNLISLLPDEKEISNRINLLLDLPIEKQIELIQPFIVNVKAK